MTEQRLEAGQQVVQPNPDPDPNPNPDPDPNPNPNPNPDPNQVVQQGVAGDTFYAVLSGVFEAYMTEAGPLPVGRFSQAEGHTLQPEPEPYP
jgi:hypothetical protein